MNLRLKTCATAVMLLFAAASAQGTLGGFQIPKMVKVPPLPDSLQIPLMPGGAVSTPGEIWEKGGGIGTVRDVTTPTISPFLPAPGKGNGAAVIIAPGGAFLMLSFASEGTMVAHWLADHGVAAFVLKYRVNPTPADYAAFQQQIAAMFSGSASSAVSKANSSPAVAWAQQDGLAALKLVRADAAKFHIDPHRIGFIGFSAGAMTAMNVATSYDPASRPDFVGSIYGAMQDRAVPADAPPLFIAVAADDPLLGKASIPMFNAWRAAGKSAELHVFSAGGHGFGMQPHGTTSDHWIDEFYWWLQANHLLTP